MLLVDSSAWILAGERLWSLVQMTEGEIVAICPPVVQELLQGADDERRFEATRLMLRTAVLLDAPMPSERFEEAAKIYQVCRDEGYTIRSSHDCLIAACAIAHGVPLLQHDRDFTFIAKFTPLKLVTRSSTAARS